MNKILFSVFLLGCVLVYHVEKNTTEHTFVIGASFSQIVFEADEYPNTFNHTVARWSNELRGITPPGYNGGNCLAVARELQKRIVDSGRMAFIVITDPPGNGDIKHASVLYDSDGDDSLDSVIDNGFLTSNYPVIRAVLYRGPNSVFGRYLGQVEECDPVDKNLCTLNDRII